MRKNQCYEQLQDNTDSFTKYCKERIDREVKKIYPDVNLEEKYLLVVNADLFFPYNNACVGTVKLITENREITADKAKIRTPYWNKSLRKISAQKGRVFCNIGIPFVFDNFDELTKVKRIVIKWGILETAIFVEVNYNIRFQKIDGRNKYFVYSKDMPLETVCRYSEEISEHSNNMINDYISEFDASICKFVFEDDTVRIKADYLHIADIQLEPQGTYHFPNTKSG
jgi:hypothetical protein